MQEHIPAGNYVAVDENNKPGNLIDEQALKELEQERWHKEAQGLVESLAQLNGAMNLVASSMPKSPHPSLHKKAKAKRAKRKRGGPK